MAITVKVSNPNFNGFRAGVRFYKGEAIFADEALGKRIAQELGYEVMDEKPTDKADNTGTPKKAPSKKGGQKD